MYNLEEGRRRKAEGEKERSRGGEGGRQREREGEKQRGRRREAEREKERDRDNSQKYLLEVRPDKTISQLLQGAPPRIPPNSSLLFEVEILRVRQ